MSDGDSGEGFVDSLLQDMPLLCRVDDEFIEDSFNLTGLKKVPEVGDAYQDALSIILDSDSGLARDGSANQLREAARILYGLVHARFLTSARGQQLMQDKWSRGEYGRCPRFACDGTNMLPVGLSDAFAAEPVKLFCPRCQELYNSLSHRVEGCFFGTTATPLLLLANPSILHSCASLPDKRYEPKVFGFAVHARSGLPLRQFGGGSNTNDGRKGSRGSNSSSNANSNNNNNMVVPVVGKVGTGHASEEVSDGDRDDGDDKAVGPRSSQVQQMEEEG